MLGLARPHKTEPSGETPVNLRLVARNARVERSRRTVAWSGRAERSRGAVAGRLKIFGIETS
jgi:hypothetical protein